MSMSWLINQTCRPSFRDYLLPVPLLHLIDCVDKNYVYVGNCTLYTCPQKFQIEILSAQCGQVFARNNGPFILALDKTLKEIKVHREAYYGGTFTCSYVSR